MSEKVFIPLVSGASFWNFKEEPLFEGKFINDCYSTEETDKLIGFTFVDSNLNEFILPHNYSIEKALDMVVSDSGSLARELPGEFKIEFLGVLKREGKNDFNRFKIEFAPDYKQVAEKSDK